MWPKHKQFFCDSFNWTAATHIVDYERPSIALKRRHRSMATALLSSLGLRRGVDLLLTVVRPVSTSKKSSKWKFTEQVEDSTTYVSVEEIAEPPRTSNSHCALCTCNIPVKLSYSDVLILEQFMREDGTVLPRQLTGLCKKQQLRLERCVMQAHWAGLFPDRTIPEFDRSGYKRFNRYWNDDMDMYRLREKLETGTWFYMKRYNTENQQVPHRKTR
ncbi:hypothetical protein RB195_010413 [Necator americanus]|uniref:Ribosomal protein S18 n=2 Tax=Necator americanus TaxID=51031 RepID=A0ABR1CZ91_NECAM